MQVGRTRARRRAPHTDISALACGSSDPSCMHSIKSLRICPFLLLVTRIEPLAKSSTLDDADRPLLPDRLRTLFIATDLPSRSGVWGPGLAPTSTSCGACAARRYESAASVFDQFLSPSIARACGTAPAVVGRLCVSLATEPQSLFTAPVSSRVRASAPQQFCTPPGHPRITFWYEENVRADPPPTSFPSSCAAAAVSGNIATANLHQQKRSINTLLQGFRTGPVCEHCVPAPGYNRLPLALQQNGARLVRMPRNKSAKCSDSRQPICRLAQPSPQAVLSPAPIVAAF